MHRRPKMCKNVKNSHRRHLHHRWWQCIAWCGSGDFAGSPWALSALILRFLRPFETTFNFEFSSAFLNIVCLQHIFTQNAAYCPDFATISIADAGRISSDLRSEVLKEVRKVVPHLFWPSYDHFSQFSVLSFHQLFQQIQANPGQLQHQSATSKS